MIKIMIRGIVSIALVLACSIAMAQQSGAKVLAQWQGGQYWFAGIVD